jgi:hypothetical protein
MILEKFAKQKRLFDVNSKTDVTLFKNFLVKQSWGSDGCPFILEQPYLGIPEMIKDKIVCKHLGIKSEELFKT